MFDPYKVVDNFMSTAPKFQSEYKFTGLWKPCENKDVQANPFLGNGSPNKMPKEMVTCIFIKKKV